jgi:hypothetical protein
VWQWRAGKRLYDVAIEEVVRPFIAVRRAQPKRGYDSDGERKPPSRRWLARQRRKETRAAAATKLSGDDVDTVPKAEAEGAEAEVDVEDVNVDDDERIESEDETGDMSATPTRASGDPEGATASTRGCRAEDRIVENRRAAGDCVQCSRVRLSLRMALPS